MLLFLWCYDCWILAMRNLVINVDVWSMMFAEILVGFHFVLNKLTF